MAHEGVRPALVTGDDAGQFDEHGGLAKIRKVTEADGSVRWWSYGGPGNRREYGKVVRGILGKSGWFSGIYSVLFMSRFPGITWNVPGADSREKSSVASQASGAI